jgi:hypothetical protein
MSFDVYLRCVGPDEQSGISRAAVRSLFPVVEEKSEKDNWRVRYDAQDECDVGVDPAPASPDEMLNGLSVNRPCGNLKFWQALLAVLRMGAVVIFWPGGPPVVADEAVVEFLPPSMIESIGPAQVVRTAEELLSLVQRS